MKIIITGCFSAFALQIFIYDPCFAAPDHKETEWRYSTTKALNVIEVQSKDGYSKRCKLNSFADRATLSFDKKTLMISTNGYVKTQSLINCSEKTVPIEHTPSKNGYLVDFNSLKKRYIALDFVALQPMSYIAYVGEIGKRKNIIDLPGAYSDKKSLKKMQSEGFGYMEESIYSPRISLNGRYATVSGEIHCSSDSHPGVWNLERNRKVIFSDDVDSSEKCESLFAQ